MKKRFFGLLPILLLAMLLCCSFALADDTDTTLVELGSGSKKGNSADGQYTLFERTNDYTEQLSSSEKDELTKYIYSFMDAEYVDVQFYFLNSTESFGFADAEEFAKHSFYAVDRPGGYGADEAGIVVVYEKETCAASAFSYNVPADVTDWSVFIANQYFEYYCRCEDYYDACYGFVDHIWRELDSSKKLTSPRTDMMTAANFVPFHNDRISRVLDFSDLLSDSEEQELLEKLDALREELETDIVVLTAPNNDHYGWNDEADMRFNDDFYDYSGFGCGVKREGAILFVNMDPKVRYYTISTTGDISYTITENEIEGIYDAMLESFKNARYEDGINIYVDTIAKYIRGDRALGEAGEEKDRCFDGILYEDIEKDSKKERVVDQAGMISDSKCDEIETMISKIKKQYGTDVLVLVASDLKGYWPEDYLDCYYLYHGYGKGSDRKGVAILISDEIEDGALIRAYGGAEKLFNESRIKKILKRLPSHPEKKDNVSKAALSFTKKTKFLCKWKHLPMGAGAVVFWIIVLYLIMSIVGKIKKSTNETIAPEISARRYIVPGSYYVNRLNEVLVDTKLIKSKKPEPSSYSSSGRSGGGGGHYSSSGTHHGGGGGRHF